MSAPPTIAIPRQPDERSAAYDARVAYVTAGPGRSLASVGRTLGKSTVLMERWSTKYGWVAAARQYDETLATLAARQHEQQYLAEVEAHRARYGVAGRALHAKALAALAQLDPATVRLGQIVRAIITAADLEAHALGVGRLLAQLEPSSRQADT